MRVKLTLLCSMLVFMMLAMAPFSSGAAPAESHLQKAEKLLRESTAARRVLDSDNAPAKARYAQALELLQQARDTSARGDQEKLDSLLNEATKIMFDATRMIEKDESFAIKDLRDYDTRLDSILALCKAYENIREEKGLGPAKDSELYPFVHRRLDQAKELKQQNQLKQGRKVLDEAYVAAKVAIEHLRGGETLVRTLEFDTAEDEYNYEVDRNDTHRMLVKMLLQEKMKTSNNIESMVSGFMQKADELRTQADAMAKGGDYKAAISTLEQSTKEIVRAIRSAGIYIPG
jgi:flagellin-specific chaperone FliS